MSAAAAAATHALSWRVSTTPSASVEWATPPAIYRALDQEFDFTLDACATPVNAKHIRYVTKDVDALGISWHGERVFCNPPYGRGLGRWMAKGVHEASEGALVVLLVPARTDTAWFHDFALRYGELRFLRGRLGYSRGGTGTAGRAPFASMVVIFRPGCGADDRVAKPQFIFPFLAKVPG